MQKTYMRRVPMFVSEGYATYDGMDFCLKGHDGMALLLGEILGDFRLIGIKSDAPSWLQDEYSEWLKYKEMV
jgi:hypothetical protein